MFIEILIAILIGVIIGTFTGLIPGLHLNLVAIVTLSFSTILLNYFNPIIIIVFIISIAITHAFVDFIPSIFLGAPNSDTALSVLPGHKLLLEGKAYEAIKLTIIGSLCGLLIAITLIPFFITTLKIIYPIIRNYIAYLLIFVSFLLIIKDKNKKWALINFIISGILGILVFNLITLKQPLLPLLSGLFGVSILLVSYSHNIRIPKQELTQTNLKRVIIQRSLISSIIAASLFSFMPGLGPAQAAILGSQISGNIGNHGFLILIGGLSTIDIILSLTTFYTIDRARNGAIVTISKITDNFTLNYLIICIASALITASIATLLTLKLGKTFSKLISKVNYKVLCITVISVITLLVLLFSGPLGILVLIISTIIGIIPQLTNTGKNHLMGCLILPVILYFIL